jgi:hypothetical protein
MVLVAAIAIVGSSTEATDDLDTRNFTELMFVFAIMVIAGTRSILQWSRAGVVAIARVVPMSGASGPFGWCDRWASGRSLGRSESLAFEGWRAAPRNVGALAGVRVKVGSGPPSCLRVGGLACHRLLARRRLRDRRAHPDHDRSVPRTLPPPRITSSS